MTTATAPLNLDDAWTHHINHSLEDRPPHRISGSDLHACAFEFKQRYDAAIPLLPHTNSSFSAFERGHAYEERAFIALSRYAAERGLRVTRSELVAFEGVEGHPDFLLYDGDTLIACIDPTTTASKSSAWGYAHALKSAFYAAALGCDQFAEFVICIGFGGNILKTEQHWFHLDGPAPGGKTWRATVTAAIAAAKAVAASETLPLPIPPTNPLDGSSESWRCDKGYCRAVCTANKRLNVPMGS